MSSYLPRPVRHAQLISFSVRDDLQQVEVLIDGNVTRCNRVTSQAQHQHAVTMRSEHACAMLTLTVTSEHTQAHVPLRADLVIEDQTVVEEEERVLGVGATTVAASRQDALQHSNEVHGKP